MKQNRAQRFYQRMEQMLGAAEAGQLIEAIRCVSPRSVRYNRGQCQPDEIKGKPVPWCSPYGRFWSPDTLPSRTVEYAAGRYYIQEASAMLAISAASQVIDFSGKIVLDLTAAPGGKATQAAELIQTGCLVANEVVGKRVNALTWNINRHRLDNVIVTSQPTALLARSLPGFFHTVIVDAPCSGEGLFQRRKHSLDNWSEKNVRYCASRQKSILEDAARLLRPGGALVYSTCTFSREENEHQVEFLLSQGFAPVHLPPDLPVSSAVSDNEAVQVCSRRIFPHREGGAGAFVSVLRKETASSPGAAGADPVKYVTGTPLESTPFIRASGGGRGYVYESRGIVAYFPHERIPEALMQRNVQIGAPLMDKRRGNKIMYGGVRFAEPERVIEIDDRQAAAYIAGEELTLPYPDGYYYTALRGMILGAVKISHHRAANHFPRPLRTACR
jgi:16S rRNA C967 or C1407 C5-methylase (RsmB/RsmF family)